MLFLLMIVPDMCGFSHSLINKKYFSVFVKFYKYIEVQFGIFIKSLQSDGGDEFTSNYFKKNLQLKGMTHTISCPYTPQQNGLVERRHHHIVKDNNYFDECNWSISRILVSLMCSCYVCDKYDGMKGFTNEFSILCFI